MPYAKNRAVIDFDKMLMYFVGPGDYDLSRSLPPGTDCYQCELAPSGHLVIPCCEHDGQTTRHSNEELSLVAQHRAERGSDRVPREEPPPGLCQYQ